MDIDFSFTRYLAAKKSVDDRALNRDVWQKLRRELPLASAEKPLQVLEIGAGIGTMVERALEWDLFGYADYTAIDSLPGNHEAAFGRLVDWAPSAGYGCRAAPDADLALTGIDARLQLHFETIDLSEYIQQQKGRSQWDLLIANAFLDLVDIPATLPGLFALCKPGGLFYFSINFDGATLFEPVIDPILDKQIERLYHRTMDERVVGGQRSGDSRAGRHMFAYLRQAGAQILAAGASDWVVYPGVDCYPQDEGYFLHFIIGTIAGALEEHPELDHKRFKEWIELRHAQVESHQLVYIAHQLDFAGRVAG